MTNEFSGPSGVSAILSNPILNTDSYKASHYLQYPPEASAMFSYIESRGGRYDRTLFFGLQMLIKAYLCRPITAPMIDEAQKSLDEGVVETADLVDAGMIFGTGFAPFRGGPLHYKNSLTKGSSTATHAAAAE